MPPVAPDRPRPTPDSGTPPGPMTGDSPLDFSFSPEAWSRCSWGYLRMARYPLLLLPTPHPLSPCTMSPSISVSQIESEQCVGNSGTNEVGVSDALGQCHAMLREVSQWRKFCQAELVALRTVCNPPPPPALLRIKMHLCLTVECITSGLHLSVF